MLVTTGAKTYLPQNYATNSIPFASFPGCLGCIDAGDARITSANLQTLSNGHPALVVPITVGALNYAGSRVPGSQVLAAVEDVTDVANPRCVLMVKVKPGGSKTTFMYSSAALTGDGQALVLQYEGSTGGSTGVSPFDLVHVLNLSGALTKTVVKNGQTASVLESSHWGDYFSVVPDPAAGNAVWTLGSYLFNDGTQHNWFFDITR